MLYIVATPIGNLKDITFRAVETLNAVDLIACEDTRHSKILLEHYGIKTPTTSFFAHNRLVKGEYLSGLLKDGKNIAVISDAGMPGILDPGYNLINLAIKNNIPVTVIPGPAAFINALVASGKPAHEFIFAGFLPNRSGARKNKLRQLSQSGCTIIAYESCHRIIASLKDIAEVFPGQEVVVARELTKKFEEILRGAPGLIIEKLQNNSPKGEFVVIV